MTIVNGLHLGHELATIFGLDPDTMPITSIKIEADVRQLARVVVEMFVTDEQCDRTVQTLQKYALKQPEAG